VVGRVAGAWGIKGWVRVESFTEEPADILDYRPWLVEADGHWRAMRVAEYRAGRIPLVVRLEDVNDRDAARALTGTRIAVDPGTLPRLPEGTYYWKDLRGLRVVTVDGAELGRVRTLMETGANDVLIVDGERERLIPWIPDVIREVDLDGGLLRVNWHPDD